MSHLNEVHEKYASRGLTVLGVTDEGKGDTERWVEQHEAHYPYAYDPGGKLQRALGVTGIPNAVLVDATGRIVWQGGPGSLDEKTIEATLGATLPQPLHELPDEAAAVAKALRKRQLDQAIEEAGKLTGEPTASLAATLQKLVDARLAAVRTAREQGDYLGALEQAESLAKEAGDLPAADEAKQIAADIKKDKDAKNVMSGQLAIRKLQDTEVRRKKEADELIEKYQRIVKKFEGTAAAREAEEAMARLQEMRERLQ